MLDLIFWSVVCLVLWFAWDTFKNDRDRQRIENENHIRMETINGTQEGHEPQNQG